MSTTVRNAFTQLGAAFTPYRWPKILATLQLWTIAGIAASNIFLGLGVLATPWKKVRYRLQRTPEAWIPAVIYLALMLGSVAISPIARRTLGGLSELLNVMPIILVVAVVDRVRTLRIVLYGFLAVATFHATHGLYEVTQGAGDLETRVHASFSHYMTFAGVMTLAIAVLLAAMLYRRAWRSWWAWPCLGLLSAASFYALTRNSWVAVFVVLAFAAVLKRGRWLMWLLPATLAILSILPVPVLARMWSPVVTLSDLRSTGTLDDVSTYDRLCMLDAATIMIRERPLLGHGPETIEHLYHLYAHPTAPQQRVPHLHNSYASLAVEQGIPSVLVLVALFVLAAICALRGLRHGNPDHSDLYAASLFGIVAFLVACLFEDYWTDTEIQRVALTMAAIPYSLRLITDRQRKESV